MAKRTDKAIAAEKDGIIVIILITLVICGLAIALDSFSSFFCGALLGYFLFCFIVAVIGRERKIGLVPSFWISFFLTPVTGLIIAVISPRLDDMEYKERMLDGVENNPAISSTVEQLHKLNELRKEGVLTNEEFEEQKYKLLNS